jgi:hypothetical protein
MSYLHPAWLEHQRKRFTRADAYRLAPPGTPEAKPPGWLDPSATRVRLKEAQEEEARVRAAAEQDAFERELLQLRWEVKKLKLEHELWLLEEKYNPNQSRVPAGSSQGGQWTSGASAVGNVAAGDSASNDAGPDSTGSGAHANVIRICMLGSHMITPDRFGNQRWWADYVCADGFTFRRFGTGDYIRPFEVDRR